MHGVTFLHSFNCYKLICNTDLSTQQAYGDVSEIPDEHLQQLGWIASGIPPEDISNLTLTEIDTIAALGQFHNLSMSQVSICSKMLSNTVLRQSSPQFIL
jgi:hypothetical protein